MNLDSLLHGYIEIASLPTVFTRISQAIANPRTSIHEISKILAEDPGLSARLLHIVNSAFYNFPRKIDTISRAIAIVGTQQLHDLALATSVMRMFNGIPKEMIDMDKFWQHSIATGIAARTIASNRREQNVERFFVAGVLHDLGRLLMFTKSPDKMKTAMQKSMMDHEPLNKSEREVFGFDHTDVGQALFETWKLPSSLVEVAAYHHSPISAGAFPVEASVVHVADIITHALEMGTSGEHMVPLSVKAAWERAGIRPNMVPLLIKQIDKQFQETANTILKEAK